MMFSPLHTASKPVRIGVVGTGFIALGLIGMLGSSQDFAVSRVLTRRSREQVPVVDASKLTHSIDDVVENSDLVVECSGDVAHAAEVVDKAFLAGLPVVTMGAEFQATVGSYFCDRGLLTEAEGDQPGSLAALHEEVVSMGFQPLVYGNIKGFLNHEPSRDEMEYWSQRNGISLPQVTSFTDGTKIQFEQALVANGLGADLVKRGMWGIKNEPLDIAGGMLARKAKARGCPVSDYVLNRDLPAGVFVVAEHPVERPEVLRYLKLGDGPFYTLLRPYHLCHLEMLRTIRRVVDGRGILLNNSSDPRINVAAIAKRDLKPGYGIGTAIGGFDLRGEAVSFEEAPDAVPMGLLKGAKITTRVEKGQILGWDDVEIPDSLALRAAWSIRERVLSVLSLFPAIDSMAA